ncbi:hypothetical protein HMPREF0208_04699 [Citrobacter koseri]|uniref:Uncharacterized protein n=1 Tax=Citrobacter koseri (strain ATCC BAA-895 / CDC 4225-83 / SGSC4696) TaxID=290338 RepID=A8AKY4_CITK8|nr:hypothetical protein CKO_03056 [Citrobacter koseri ATCC BAA-895]KWZ95873.1 hypothetical protein HMPREF3220_03882 [Citrobacter koseri]KXA02768.1 hypothetical protein HMPREF3207_02210 [Citrobacter koseri]KXB39688.1 hypothetical protein HMPREF0208_04699 [Citrobacter koseri]
MSKLEIAVKIICISAHLQTLNPCHDIACTVNYAGLRPGTTILALN